MTEHDPAFAELLKEFRLAAGLTQETLAERAGLGVRSIQSLERGGGRPQRDTLRRLADALALPEAERARLLAVGAPSPRRSTAVGTATPPPRSPGVPKHNLPLALTALIGREAEQAEVSALLAEARLVTLTGSGGVGKTRLALAVAGELVDQYPDGVWLVELAALAEERLVGQTALETLGMREEAGRPLLATLTEHLKEQRLLLVLDNCEHMVVACADLAEAVLRRCGRRWARRSTRPCTPATSGRCGPCAMRWVRRRSWRPGPRGGRSRWRKQSRWHWRATTRRGRTA